MKREETRVKRDKLESIGDNHPLDLVVWWRHTFENLHACKRSSSTLRFVWNHTAKSNHILTSTQLKINSKAKTFTTSNPSKCIIQLHRSLHSAKKRLKNQFCSTDYPSKYIMQLHRNFQSAKITSNTKFFTQVTLPNASYNHTETSTQLKSLQNRNFHTSNSFQIHHTTKQKH